MPSSTVRALIIAAGSLLSACAGVSRQENAARVAELVRERSTIAAPAVQARLPADEAMPPLPAAEEPLSLGRALEIAFLRNARLREEFARLGFAEADLYEASRIANPIFGFSDLRPSEPAEAHQITRSVALSFADVLLLPASRRIARGELERVRRSIAGSLIDLTAEVEQAWFEAVSARQVAAMRGAVAEAAATAAEFAGRSYKAGNIAPRDLALELATASAARIEATRAEAEAIRARSALAAALGVASRENWRTPEKLPAPPTDELDADALTAQALEARLDLAAARLEVRNLEDAFGVARRWRWLGEFTVGYEHEDETDGAKLKGPSFELGLPLFDTGRGGVLRAESELESARSRLAILELAVRNEVSLGIDRLHAARDIVERYRTALVPQREEVLRRELERYNFMLGGVFELLQAKREEFDAYQEYLEAVREYWTARSELRRAAGGRLPGDAAALESTLGVESILDPSGARSKSEEKDDHATMDHSAMDHSQMDHATMDHPSMQRAAPDAPKSGEPQGEGR